MILVVLVDISENDVQVRRVSSTQERIWELMIQFGNTKGKQRDGVDSDSEMSDAEMYDEIESSVRVDD